MRIDSPVCYWIRLNYETVCRNMDKYLIPIYTGSNKNYYLYIL